MEINNDNKIRIEKGIQRKIVVPASEIIKKFRTKNDRQAFCKENSNYIHIMHRFIFSR